MSLSQRLAESLDAVLDSYVRRIAREESEAAIEDYEYTPAPDPSPVPEPGEPVVEPPAPQPTHGEYAVGADAPFDSLQAAYDAVPVGGSAHITLTERYDPDEDAGGVEMLPVENDEQNFVPKAIHLEGQGQDVTFLGVEGAECDTLRYRGGTVTSYRRPFVISNLSFRGAAGYRTNEDGKRLGRHAGLVLEAAPFSKGENLGFTTEGHGFEARPAWTSDGTLRDQFNLTFRECDAFNCTGTAYRLNTKAACHKSVLRDCTATACGEFGAMVRGYAVAIRDGTYQLNYNCGIDARGGHGQIIDGSYIEGNGRGQAYPLEIYVEGVKGMTITDVYGNGINPRSTPGHDHNHVQALVKFKDCESFTFRDATYQNYDDAVVLLADSTGNLGQDGHTALDGSPFIN